MIRITLILVSLTIMAVNTIAQTFKGIIASETLTSQALRENKTGLSPVREIKVYLPQGYASSTQRYPVVYYCHNIFWGPPQIIEDGRMLRLLDRAFDENISRDFILVFADYRAPGMGCMYENSTTTGRWLDFTTKELVPYIDSKFRTIAHRDSRAAIGDFFGGRGALKLGMTSASLFSVVYAMHPVATGNGSIPWSASNVDWKKLNSAKTFDDLRGPDRTQIFMNIHQAFLPNPNRPPFYCDLSMEPVNGQIQIIPANIEQTKKAFLLDQTLVESLDNLKTLRGIAFDWGRYDETRAHVESNREFSMRLDDLGIQHQAEEFNGTPFNKLMTDDGRFFTRVIPFLDQHLSFEKTPNQPK